MGNRILIVDDEPDITDLLKYNLENEGYDCATAGNGEEALAIIPEFNPDLILLDIMMPVMDGIETCTRIRSMERQQQTFIVFLTARGEEYSEMAGFDAGADDYITKPIKPRVLIKRLKAILKREVKSESSSDLLEVGDVSIDRSSYTVTVNGREVNMPKKEFELLYLLISKPTKVFKREKILSEVWGDDVYVGDRTIDVHIRKIREKIGEKKIKTVKGVGYKFEL